MSNAMPEPQHELPPPAERRRRAAARSPASSCSRRSRASPGLRCAVAGSRPRRRPPSTVAGDAVTLDENAPQWSYLELAVAEEKPALSPPPAPGRVTFDEKRSAAAGSPLPGRIEQVQVRLGDQVKPGDRLFAVRSGALADLDRELESARNEVAAKTRIAERARALVALRAAPEKDQLEAEEDLRAGAARAARRDRQAREPEPERHDRGRHPLLGDRAARRHGGRARRLSGSARWGPIATSRCSASRTSTRCSCSPISRSRTRTTSRSDRR